MIDSIHGAKSSAIIYSIVETAKANNLKPFDYVQHLLEEIPKHMDERIVLFWKIFCPGQKNFRQGSAKLKYRWLQSSHLKMSRYSLFCVYLKRAKRLSFFLKTGSCEGLYTIQSCINITQQTGIIQFKRLISKGGEFALRLLLC